MAAFSFFSSEAFLGSIAAACYPRQRWTLETVEVEGRVYRVLVVGGRIVDDAWNHPFFYEPLDSTEATANRRIPFLASVSHGVAEAPKEDLRNPWSPAPFIDWARFETWDQFQAFSRKGPFPAQSVTLARARRRLERDHGQLVTSLHDDDPAAFDALIAWKAAQFRRTGVPDPFVDPSSRAIYRELADRNLLMVSTIRAGGRVVAGTLGMRWERRFYYRLITHDPALSLYSPGALACIDAIRQSFAAGDRQFEFLRGGELYKWNYATHAHVVGPLGLQPRSQRASHWIRARAGRVWLRWRERRTSAGQVVDRH